MTGSPGNVEWIVCRKRSAKSRAWLSTLWAASGLSGGGVFTEQECDAVEIIHARPLDVGEDSELLPLKELGVGVEAYAPQNVLAAGDQIGGRYIDDGCHEMPFPSSAETN